MKIPKRKQTSKPVKVNKPKRGQRVKTNKRNKK